MNNYLALLGMSHGEFVVFLTALGGGITSLTAAYFTWKSKKDQNDFELARLDREEKRLEKEAANKLKEREQIAREKMDQHKRDIELARLTKETAKGIQQSISRKAEEVKTVVTESKEERKQQIEEIKALNVEAIDKANNTNQKILDLGIKNSQEPVPVTVTNFPEKEN